MKKLQFKIEINSPVEKVFNTMLGLDSVKTYEQWTAVFNPTSTYEGSWNKGAKILFVGVDEHGKRGGMVSEINENILNKFISIRHYGILDGDVEITEGPMVEKWTGGLENYSFAEEGKNKTSVSVDVDITEEYLDYFNEHWPKALEKLKEICEQ